MRNILLASVLVFGLTGCQAVIDALLEVDKCDTECSHCHKCDHHRCSCD